MFRQVELKLTFFGAQNELELYGFGYEMLSLNQLETLLSSKFEFELDLMSFWMSLNKLEPDVKSCLELY